MSRTFMVYVNVDEMNASLVAQFNDQSKAQWVSGFQAGCSGVAAEQDWTKPMVTGHAVGYAAWKRSMEYREKMSQAGAKSAAKRTETTGSAQPVKPQIVEPSSNQARTTFEPGSNQARTIQYPVSSIGNPETENQVLGAEVSAQATKRFTPPAVSEVAEYCRERSNGIDAQKFCDYYESKGWVIGKTKMKSWQAAVRNWESNQSPKPSAKPTGYVDESRPETLEERAARHKANGSLMTREQFAELFPDLTADLLAKAKTSENT